MNNYAKAALIVMFAGLFIMPAAKAQSGEKMTLSEFEKVAVTPKNEIWVVDFWASWCRPCIAIIPELKEIQKRMPEAKVRFFSISLDEDKSDWLNALDRLKMPWTQILMPDPSSPQPFIDSHFKFDGIPSLWIISPSGKVKKTDEGILEIHLQRLLKKM
jgi:thiol-disulfide isomerase/thioredoxin